MVVPVEDKSMVVRHILLGPVVEEVYHDTEVGIEEEGLGANGDE